MKENEKYIEIDKCEQTMKKTKCMKIYKGNESLLFSIGNEMIVKKGMQSISVMNEEMNFFYPSRIIFIQLKDKNKHPNRKRMCITSLTTNECIGKLDDETFEKF